MTICGKMHSGSFLLKGNLLRILLMAWIRADVFSCLLHCRNVWLNGKCQKVVSCIGAIFVLHRKYIVNPVGGIYFTANLMKSRVCMHSGPPLIRPPYLPRNCSHIRDRAGLWWEGELYTLKAVVTKICGLIRGGGLCWEWPLTEGPL